MATKLPKYIMLILGDVALRQSDENFGLESFHKEDRIILTWESPVRRDSMKIYSMDFSCSPENLSKILSQQLFLNLANNHILDRGRSGLDKLKSYCHDNGVQYFGTTDVPEFEINGYKFVSFTTFSNLKDTEDLICAEPGEVRNKYVIVHGGVMFVPVPSPVFREFCRSLIDKGALGVICSHNHVLSYSEWYKGRYICYGLGDLYFASPAKYRRRSLGIRICDNNKLAFVEIIRTNNGFTITDIETPPLLKPYMYKKNAYKFIKLMYIVRHNVMTLIGIWQENGLIYLLKELSNRRRETLDMLFMTVSKSNRINSLPDGGYDNEVER
ncbi:CapA family protein [Schleiferiaceae bacterium]|nr:CapA family protein [Schleiferiaceae bacterium]